jgi:hypothetical protein
MKLMLQLRNKIIEAEKSYEQKFQEEQQSMQDEF